MRARLISIVLLSNIYVSSALPGNSSLTKRYNLGPFDKGTQFETKDRGITLEVPPAIFCGDEKLKGVAQRLNPSKTYDVSLNGYLIELRKATPPQRRNMLLGNLKSAQNKLPAAPQQCQAQVTATTLRQLQVLNPLDRAWIVTIIKISIGTAIFGTTIDFRHFVPNMTQPFIAAGTVYLNVVFFAPLIEFVIDDINNRLPRDLSNIDEWQALAITMLQQTIQFVAQVIDWTTFERPDPRFVNGRVKRDDASCNGWDQGYANALSDLLPYVNGGSSIPVRPYSEVQSINNIQNKNACPNEYVETGSGEVAVG